VTWRRKTAKIIAWRKAKKVDGGGLGAWAGRRAYGGGIVMWRQHQPAGTHGGVGMWHMALKDHESRQRAGNE